MLSGQSSDSAKTRSPMVLLPTQRDLIQLADQIGLDFFRVD
jgi:hypothetical protein